MATQFVFPGRVTDGAKPVIEDVPRYRKTLESLAGKPVEFVIRKPQSKRSLEQNAWHWGIAVPMIAEALGYDRHEYDGLHYALVSKCFGVKRDEKTGLEIPNKRSSQLTTTEFYELMEWEARYAAQEWGVVLPMPSEAEAL